MSLNKQVEPYTKHHKDGSLWAKGQMLAGEMHGYWEWYRVDGSLLRTGHLKAGDQVGEWTTYDRDGKVVKVTQMKQPHGQ